ncbi:MAG: hypothetical protein ACYC2T_13095 [Bacillota bacterium]
MLLQNLTQKHSESQEGLLAVQGKLQGHELVVVNGFIGGLHEAFHVLVDEFSVEKIIGLGYGDQTSPLLRPGDMIISGEIWEDGDNDIPVVYPADPKLVDLCLAAAEKVDVGEELRALVGRLVDTVDLTQDETQGTTVYYSDSLATMMAKLSYRKSIPFVMLHGIISSADNEDEEIHRKNAKQLFWVLKGVLDELKNPYKEI